MTYTVPSALLILFSCTAAADALFLDNLEEELGLTDSLSASYVQRLTPKQQQFTGNDCHEASRQTFVNNGLTSGVRSTHCYVTEFNGNKVESYFQTNPDGSYTNGFTWTFE
ncbi:hypothetical protein [Vibrio sp. CAU 1672]|uniref:hypothetical protein n=1 Tax=Vibrio sp. CAU 1672 TaxID=3032594 RepID=UPI0023DBB35E|nr:hypothetical protein [Vibrio sp. CAU 1672]MDF2152528.1 hypothetical protein [Vibrio sp. CAU 1672]